MQAKKSKSLAQLANRARLRYLVLARYAQQMGEGGKRSTCGFHNRHDRRSFQVMRDHSILGALMNKTSTHDKKAFLEGVDAGAGEGGLLAHLFAVRANGLFGRLTESARPITCRVS